jgi:hypothetical protein
LSNKARPFTHGYEIYFENATIHYELGSALVVYGPAGVEKPTLESADPIDCFAAEIGCAVEGVAGGRTPAGLAPELARDALALCLKEEESARTGRVVNV